ncbi:MAG: polyribonucleotide nucleotidyltransferase [Helicobacteraceae bacterium]|jgi:polyribonucleotide nucleotidyltransferase|nr:polyribonucleotide nucleotidyltransferase [Helicobacteraceae bacterium]
MNYHIVEIAPARAVERFTFGKVAKQADGAVWFEEGENVLLATVTYEEPSEDADDFLPLTVQYIEKTYAIGKFPGGFIKRENKPSDFETLASRIVDRTLRPLFPKGLTAPILITVTVLSCNEDADLQRLAVLAAQAALYASSLPAKKCVSAVRIGMIGGELVVNPTLREMSRSAIDLFVCGSAEELLMIEMQSLWAKENGEGFEISEEKLLEAIALAQENIKNSAIAYEQNFKPIAKIARDLPLKSDVIAPETAAFVEQNYKDQIKAAIAQMSKSERGGELNAIAAEAAKKLNLEDSKPVLFAVEALKKSLVRSAILRENRRADGRGLDEIRPITIETNVLPRAHGSALFTRGQTQALAVATLGGDSDRQGQERLTDTGQSYEKFMLHYNFPGFSVGEAKRIGAPGRRELGHGNLAKRAIESQIDPRYDNTIRIVSEILESNGSSSMASVCGGTMALRAANVPMRKLVAGVAMGLVTEGSEFRILTDITGLEDHDGDMDFKVAGTDSGITAMQMDIKLGGLPLETLRVALEKARNARLSILEKMRAAESAIKLNLNALPGLESFGVDPKAIPAIIGKGGAVINELVETYGVKIDLDKENGGVKVRGSDAAKVEAACVEIKRIAENARMGGGHGGGASHSHGGAHRERTECKYAIGEEIEGKIAKVADFGLFVDLPDGNSGLVHISKIGAGGKRIARLADHYREGESAIVIYEGQDEKKKVSLNIRDKLDI